MINLHFGKISTITISTIFGHSGRGIFPYSLSPSYRKLLKAAKRTKTTIFSKSGTALRRRGNWRLLYPWAWKYVQRIGGDGLLNTSGLTNMGTSINAKNILLSHLLRYQVIPNFYPEFSKGTNLAIRETLWAISEYRKILKRNFWAAELNLSCPNAREVITENTEQGALCIRQVKKNYPWLIIIVKTSIVHLAETLQEWQAAGADIFHCINTIPFLLLYPNIKSPLINVGGGSISGGPTSEKAFAHNVAMRKAVKGFMIFGCGIMNEDHVKSCLGAGAQAVSFCTAIKFDPDKVTRIITEYNQ